MRKKVAVLGSTGSIGVQSLEVIQHEGLEVTALAAHSNVDLLLQQIQTYQPQVVAVTDEWAAQRAEALLAGMRKPPKLLRGAKGLQVLAGMGAADVTINAVVGIAGLAATMCTLEAGCDVALANKESLVTGGRLVQRAAQQGHARLLPVDSEHSAIFQCIQDSYTKGSVNKILLTASGGPFWGRTAEQLKGVTPEEALQHPNWSMGKKITIDSATLMNKGLELIEAVWLFDVRPEQVEVVVHRQSIIHSMVQLSDHSVLAQMGVPDMRLPIQYALTWPVRSTPCISELDFSNIKSLTFAQPDEAVFRCLPACRRAIQKGGLAPCAANGANEQAVELFLKGKISFLKIGELVEQVVDRDSYGGEYTIDDVYECDRMARAYVLEHSE